MTLGGKVQRFVDAEVVPVLYVENASRAVSWYERLGFRKEWEHQFEPGFPWFVSVARGQARLYLSEHKGDARPNTLIHLYVDDIDAVSKEFGVPIDEGRFGRTRVRLRRSRRQQVAGGDATLLRVALIRADGLGVCCRAAISEQPGQPS